MSGHAQFVDYSLMKALVCTYHGAIRQAASAACAAESLPASGNIPLAAAAAASCLHHHHGALQSASLDEQVVKRSNDCRNTRDDHDENYDIV